MKSQYINIAIFASGGGSNADKIIEYFKGHERIKVVLVVSSHAEAGVLLVGKKHGIPAIVLDKNDFKAGGECKDVLMGLWVEFIALAGFIWHVPEWLVRLYHRRMLNIHPALLPLHGGKGMYGARVHASVKQSGDLRSGMTVHWVTSNYDEGAAVFQASTAISASDTVEGIAKKVLNLEHRYYPCVIEYVIKTYYR